MDEIIKIVSDGLTPVLQELGKATEARRAETLQAAGLQLCNMARRSFTNVSLRPSPWPRRKDDLPHNLLLKTGTLRNSLRVVSSSASSVTVGSDRVYAAIHQFGGTITPKKKKALVFKSGGKTIIRKKIKIPARPFFPILNDELTDMATRQLSSLIRLKLSLPEA